MTLNIKLAKFMVRNHSYARQKLRETIYSLATGPGDIRKRLTQAYNGFLLRLENKDFPVKLQSDWEWIQKELKKFPIKREDGSFFRGDVENTCAKIKNSTGVKIAERMLKIYLSLESD